MYPETRKCNVIAYTKPERRQRLTERHLNALLRVEHDCWKILKSGRSDQKRTDAVHSFLDLTMNGICERGAATDSLSDPIFSVRECMNILLS